MKSSILLLMPIFIGGFFFFGIEATAKSKHRSYFQCTSREEIDSKTRDCNDNAAYAEAAVLCYNKIKSLVDRKTQEAKSQLKDSVTVHTSDGKNSQTNSTQGGASNYQISQDVLNELITASKQARNQVGNYIKDIYVPDEIALAEAGFDLDEIFLSEPCYADNRNILLYVEEDIYKIIDDLEAAKNTSHVLQNNSLQKKDSYDTSIQNQMIQSGRGESAELKGQKQSKPESDISGTGDKKNH